MARSSASMTYASVTLVVVGLSLITTVASTGNFFVGLLKYDNLGNLDNSGNCCDGNSGPGGMCTEVCDLIFEITVTGLGRNPQTRQWSTEPVSGESISSFSHPVSFNFTRWPDEVNVTVDVYDSDGATIGTQRNKVDQFHTVFTHQGAELFYILQPLKGQRSINASLLTILFRYKCDPTQGPQCFTDCVDHKDNEVCPTLPPFTGTFQTATDPYCEHTGNNSGNCSAIDVTTQPLSETSTSNANVSTKRVYLDSGNNSKNQTTLTNHIFSHTHEQTTSAKVSVKGTTATPSVSSDSTSTSSTKTKSTTKVINVSVQETIPGTSLTTTVDPPLDTPPTVYKDEDGGMTYWPAIVGGVLGGLALLAAAGFLVYYKRQKKLQKRQEIYNVNPKILRKFEEYAENGTSGRADVPLETEQV